MENASVPGIYEIGSNIGPPMKVFCDFDFSSNISWTLVNSYYFQNNSIFKKKPFFRDRAFMEDTPNFETYRMSLARMLELKNSSRLWKASCNYETAPRTTRDTIIGSFERRDLFFSDGGLPKTCSEIMFINIRGFLCTKPVCRVRLRTNKMFTPFVSVSNSRFCGFEPTTNGSEQAFGGYDDYNPEFSCVSHPHSSTHWWFGDRIDK